MKRINVSELLFEICEDKAVYDPDCELLESEILDSLAFIELFSRLEDEGIELQPTRIDRSLLSTPRKIEKLINKYLEEN
ncbi:MAG: D-alanine--poly(phosphoribitol) ligase subunit 2 [Clostridia bacterium]|nr:D-alanine--poly(phosphoribitol) ligase subunit 2 [Clostridia bacterium]